MRLVQPPNTSVYDVKSSDTVASIALRYNTTPTELSRLNHLSSSLLYPGQTLFVPHKSDHNEEECTDKETEQLVTIGKQSSDSILISPPHCSSPTREMTFSPDQNLEHLLGLDYQHSCTDEISAKYLKIKSKYITDGQGVVSGVLLVTPQTVMFNPCVSDHLVIDRGRDCYVVRLSLKAISRLAFFEDIAAMVTGDISKQFHPNQGLSTFKFNSLPKPGTIICQTTGEEFKLSSAQKEEETIQRDLQMLHIQQTREKFLHKETEKKEEDMRQEVSADQGISSLGGSISADHTITDDTLTSVNSHLYRQRHNDEDNHESEDNHHDLSLFMEESHESSTPKHKAKLVNNALHTQSNEHFDDGETSPHKDKFTNVNILQDKRTLVSPSSDLSKDSGISEINTTNFSQHDSQDSDIVAHPPLAGRSSLSNEAKQWLGNRGIRLSSMDSDNIATVSQQEDISEEVLPRPASKYDDDLIYVAIKVHKNYWHTNRTKQNNVMGIPPNRDQKRRQHWFAIPKERVDQFYGFLLQWSPDSDVLLSNASTPRSEEFHDTEEGLNIVDDAFANSPATSLGYEKLTSEDAMGMKARVGSLNSCASKTSLRSLGDDESPDLLDDSQLLTKKQVRMLARRLPSRTVGHSWELVYSTHLHGISLSTLYRNFQDYDSPAVIIVKDETQKVFGAFLSEPPRVSDGFFGNGESMLFTFDEQNKLTPYNWTGENNFFLKGSKISLAIGGGEGVFGLWLDEDLYRGRSHSCKTFGNETLSGNEDFICSGLEAWSFV